MDDFDLSLAALLVWLGASVATCFAIWLPDLKRYWSTRNGNK